MKAQQQHRGGRNSSVTSLEGGGRGGDTHPWATLAPPSHGGWHPGPMAAHYPGRWLQGLSLGWRYHQGKIYYFSGEQKAWGDAEAACRFSQSHLTSITSPEEQVGVRGCSAHRRPLLPAKPSSAHSCASSCLHILLPAHPPAHGPA